MSRVVPKFSFFIVLTTGAASSINVCHGTRPVSTTTTAMYKAVHTTSVAMIPRGKSRCGFLHSSAAVETESNPMYVKNTMDPPVRIPGHPFGANGCQCDGLMNRDATPM